MKLKEVGWGAEDKEVYTFMLNKLEEQKEPFIYYTISMSSHEPYNLINSVFYDKIFNDINDVRVRNYFNSMRYVDKALEDAITKILRKHPDAIIFIFGDHCSNIRENPYYKNSRVITKSKIAIEFVPLFIVSSELTPYIEKNKVASLLDISPTIIYLSRIKTSIRTFGENLLNPKKLNNSIYFRNEEYSRKELYKLIFNEIKKYMIGF